MNSAIANKVFVLSLYHKLQDLTNRMKYKINQSNNQSVNQSIILHEQYECHLPRDETISRYLFYEGVLKDRIA